MIASSASSGTRTTAPRCDSASSGEVEVLVARRARRPRARRCPRGRSTGCSASPARPARRRKAVLSIRARRYRGRDRENRLLGEDQRADLAEQALDVLRLHRDDDERRRRQPRRGSRAWPRRRGARGARATRSARRAVAATSDGSRQPDDSSPEMSDSPIRPAPRMAIFRESTIARECTAGQAAVRDDARTSRALIHARSAHESALEALQEIDAREPLPFAVRLEELGGLAWLGPTPTQRGEELHESQVVGEAGVVAAEPLQREGADRPWADAPFALESRQRIRPLCRSPSRSRDRGRASSASRRGSRRARIP